MKYYYHFTSDKLRDGRPIPAIGEWLEHIGPIVPCQSGLHASEHPFDALQYAPAATLHLVELDGEIVPHETDKVVARRRKIVKTIDATPVLRRFAADCALSVAHLWDMPDVVRRYLETLDESKRAAARASQAAAWDAAWATAWDALDAARAALDAALDAARAAARDAARDAARAAWAAALAAWAAARAAARDAARDAAWDAAWAAETDKQRARFKQLVDDAFASV